MNELEFKIQELERKINYLFKINNNLIKENKQLIKENKQLKLKNKQLKEKIKTLENKIERYKVKPNDPPGSKPDYLKPKKEPKTKPGRKPGFKGKSRLNPTNIDYIKEIKPKFCKFCNSNNLKTIKIRKKYISDVEFRVVNIEEQLHNVICNCCGKKTKALSNNGELQSPFGQNILSLIAYLRNISGISLGNLKNLFNDYFKLDICKASISNNEILLSKLSKLKYISYLDEIKKSSFSHKDETSYRIAGNTSWIWVYDNLKYVFYRLSKTRGKKTLIEDFGENPKSISINDCYSSYNLFEKQQICWAHLLRELKHHSEKENKTNEEIFVYKKFKEIYIEAKEFVSKGPPDNLRLNFSEELKEKVINLMISIKNRTDFLIRFFKRIEKYINSLFLFVKYKDISSTNNQAERDLRPFVIFRKASFGSYSFNGGLSRVIFKTLFENSKRKGIPLHKTLKFIFENYKKDIIA
jgi:regulator of replication initiation timing